MIIASCTIYDDEYGKLDLSICTDEHERDIEKSIIIFSVPLAKAIMKAAVHNSKEFVCNEYTYKLLHYASKDNEEAFNKYRRKKVDLSNYSKPNTIFLYKNNTVCITCKNKYGYSSIVNVNAIVNTIRDNTKKEIVDVQYCNHCKNYYMDSESLKLYEKKYGPLFISLQKREIDGWNSGDREYQADTVLSRYGYSTTRDNDIRKKIIKMLIDSGISCKSEIKGILSGFIHNRSNRCYRATPIWESDLFFTNQYNTENQRNIKGDLKSR